MAPHSKVVCPSLHKEALCQSSQVHTGGWDCPRKTSYQRAVSGKIAACWKGPGIWGWKGACAHPARSSNKPWYCVSPPGVFSCPLYMAPCLWFRVARDEARAINRNMRDERLAKRNKEEVLVHWLDTESKTSQGTTNQDSCHRTQGQHQAS